MMHDHLISTPWGRLDWLFQRLPSRQWSFIGCCGTEERSRTAWEELYGHFGASNGAFFRIADPPSKYSAETNTLLRQRAAEIATKGPVSFLDVPLIEGVPDAVAHLRGLVASGAESVVLDISSLPKRYFFILIKTLMKMPEAANVVVTYTVPESYPQDVLAESHDDWQALPGFGQLKEGEADFPIAFIGIGYMPLGLASFVKGQTLEGIRPVFPFPSTSDYLRNWLFLEEVISPIAGTSDPIRINPLDVPETFNYFVKQTQSGKKAAMFAPFGPKPMSLSMCLYAVSAEMDLDTTTPVFYSQPRVYHPNFSLGVSRRQNDPEIYAYVIKWAGQRLFQITNT